MPQSHNNIILKVENVAKTFGSKQVLKNINFSIQQGETFVVLGGSGSGKSVLLKSILGLITPDNGTISIDGNDMIQLSPKQREGLMCRFGMLFQNGALFDSMTIWENVAFELIQAGVTPKRAREIAIQKLALVDLAPHNADLAPAELSGGMRKRAALARALCGSDGTPPDIMIYDEPTTGLDPITTDVINNLILKLQKDLNLTSIVITHNIPSAYKVGDRIAMLRAGEFIQIGTPQHIKTSTVPYVQQFIQGLAELPQLDAAKTTNSKGIRKKPPQKRSK